MPRATYRLQLQDGFAFAEVASLAPWLASNGVSHVYLSPVLEAMPASTHGYDVVDPRRLRASFGGDEAWRTMVDALRRHGVGILVDIVPNHLAFAVAENPLLWDVLTHGPASRYAPVFDLAWESQDDPGRSRVLLAVLDDHYSRVLDAGRIRIVRDGGVVTLHVDDARFPLDPRTLDDAGLSGEGIDADAAVAACNADLGRLDRLLDRQHYRLAHWRVSRHELDHRRFFDVNSLIAVAMDRPGVFDLVHERVLRLVHDGDVDGLRVDHVDGLRRPGGYLRELRARAPGCWILVEKILERGEPLPDWPVDGTTGYDALADIQAVLTDPEGEAPLTELYQQLTDDVRPFTEIAADCKRLVIDELLEPDLGRAVEACRVACGPRRRWRDLTRADLRAALRETLVALPVYRTYLSDGRDARSGSIVTDAVTRAREAGAGIDPLAFDALEALLVAEDPVAADDGFDDAARAAAVAAIEQLSAPVMAKGVEDTAFYRYHRFIAANEVGGDPSRWAMSADAFHAANRAAVRGHPARLVATSTHDTKRSEDLRARLLVLAERPAWWSAQLRAWFALDERRSVTLDAPTRVLLYQTLVGAHPLSRPRAVDHLRKAAREAKLHTSWLAPDAAYEAALERFVDAVLDDAEVQGSLAAFVASIEPMARANSLAQVLLRCTVPGVPDLYQRNEHLVYDLVDPDNRHRLEVDDVLGRTPPDAPPDDVLDPRAKHWVTRQALAVRAARPAAFCAPTGTYEPVVAVGEHAANLLGLRRGDDVLALVTLRSGTVRDGWGATTLELPAGRWHDVIADREHEGMARLDDVFALLPVALLVRAETEGETEARA